MFIPDSGGKPTFPDLEVIKLAQFNNQIRMSIDQGSCARGDQRRS